MPLGTLKGRAHQRAERRWSSTPSGVQSMSVDLDHGYVHNASSKLWLARKRVTPSAPNPWEVARRGISW